VLASNKIKQALLIVKILPSINSVPEFAVKGGTGINYFSLDLPRVSIDIDLAFIPIMPRKESIESIGQGLVTLGKSIRDSIPNAKVNYRKTKDGHLSKLDVVHKGVSVIIEPNFVKRGTVYEPVKRGLSEGAKSALGISDNFKVKLLSNAELFAGKITAALDRQAPRDLYDIKNLMDKEGLTTETRKAFIVYLISNPRPMHELLNANIPDKKLIEKSYNDNLKPMMRKVVSISELMNMRSDFITTLNNSFLRTEKDFLLSFKSGKPRYELLGVENAKELPAVQWKQMNIKKMSEAKHAKQLEKLAKVLGVSIERDQQKGTDIDL